MEQIKINIVITPMKNDESLIEFDTEGIKVAQLPEMFEWISHNIRVKDKRKIKRVK